MFSCQIRNIFQNTYLEENLWTTAFKHRNSFPVIFCRSCCSALINAVMKYSYSAAVVQSWRVLCGNLLKIALHQSFFQRISRQLQNSQKQPPECSIIKGVLRNFAKVTGKHLCQSLFCNKVVGLRPATLLKKRLWHRCFPVNFVKFLRRPFLQNTSGQLLLNSEIEKCILMAASEDKFILEKFLHGCFSKAAADVYSF